MLKQITIALIAAVFIAACSSIDPSVPISHIVVEIQGKNNTANEHMTTVCKGFFMSPELVKDFYHNASLISEKGKNSRYEMLPCYATGTAYIYGIKYTWVIRSGGIGEFFNDQSRFTKICGKKCCDKIKKVC